MIEIFSRLLGANESGCKLSEQELLHAFKSSHLTGVYSDAELKVNVKNQTVTVHRATGEVEVYKFTKGRWTLVRRKKEAVIWGLGGYK